MGCLSFYRKVERFTDRVFGRYGAFVAENAWTLIFVSLISNIFLGLGLTRMEIEEDIELLYTPKESQASKDRAIVNKLFGDDSATNFFQHSLSGAGSYGDVIFQSKNGNILSPGHLMEVKTVYEKLVNQTFSKDDKVFLQYGDVCAKRDSRCVVTGEIIFSPGFLLSIQLNNITYPLFGTTTIKGVFGDTTVVNGTLTKASYIKLRFNLRTGSTSRQNVQYWMKSFLNLMKEMSLNKTVLYYAHSESLGHEISSHLDDDIVLFALTFVFMILYSSFATANWKCISDKQNLAKAGVLATLLAVVGSIGLVTSCQVKFVAIVGVMPFLILGIGVDDMFVLLTGLAETYDEDPEMKPKERIQKVMKSSGVSITITSLTDLIAFYVGTSSSFLSVKNFCVFTGAAVFLCYLNYMTLFMGCMTVHEKRVAKGAHCCTGKSQKPKERNEGNTETNKSCLCIGTLPKKREDIEGPMEKYPQRVLSRFILTRPSKVVIIVVFLNYIGISIWGALHFEQGLDLNALVPEKSYLYNYNEIEDKYFPKNIPVSLVIRHKGDFSGSTAWDIMQKLQTDAEKDTAIDPIYTLNWMRDYRIFPLYDGSSETRFLENLKNEFLKQMPIYKNDVIFDVTNGRIKASRIFVFSEETSDTNVYHDLMPRMRELVESSFFDSVIAYSPAFIFYEQYQTVLPETIQNLGITVLAIFLVTSIFLPHPVLIFFITLTLIMILVGLFGFMYFWDLSLSFLTMIHILMSVGFSVDFSAHICHGFMDTRSPDRHEGARGAIKKAGAPIFNGALSSFIGVSMLIFSKSYIFQSFFKIMLLIILFGAAHSLFFLPTILSLIGPKFDDEIIIEAEQEKGNKVNNILVFPTNQVSPVDINSKPKFIPGSIKAPPMPTQLDAKQTVDTETEI